MDVLMPRAQDAQERRGLSEDRMSSARRGGPPTAAGERAPALEESRLVFNSRMAGQPLLQGLQALVGEQGGHLSGLDGFLA